MSDNDAISMQDQTQESNQENEKEETMESLMGEYSEDFSFQMPVAGEIRDGIIASISGSQILVSVGAKSEGLIVGKEFEAIPAELLETFEVGKAIPVFVVTPTIPMAILFFRLFVRLKNKAGSTPKLPWHLAKALNRPLLGITKGGCWFRCLLFEASSPLHNSALAAV